MKTKAGYERDRYIDLLKLGIWKAPPKARKQKKPAVLIACDKCHNWHPRGKHSPLTIDGPICTE